MTKLIETTDAAASMETTYTLPLGKVFQGNLATIRDSDWLAVDLLAGRDYVLSYKPIGGGSSTEANLRSPEGIKIAGQQFAYSVYWNDGDPGGYTYRVSPTESGTYFVELGGKRYSGRGDYKVSMVAQPIETTDAPATIETPYTVDPWGSFTGSLSEANDTDWVALNLRSMTNTRIILKSEMEMELGLYDADGTLLSVVRDIEDAEASLTWSLQKGGTVFLSARAVDSSETGEYSLRLISDPTVRSTIGSDRIRGDQYSDGIKAGPGDDWVNGLGGTDRIEGGDGNDTLLGDDGRDYLWGDDGDDKLFGGNYYDYLDGGNGHDRLFGGAHSDRLLGWRGRDFLNGGSGDDRLEGQVDSDVLIGGSGNDFLFGGKHSDILNGGTGDDILTGGYHADRFVFAADGGDDVIKDFKPSQGDVIDLRAVNEITSFLDLQDNHLTQDGDHAVIRFETGSVTLMRTDDETLTADDFLF